MNAEKMLGNSETQKKNYFKYTYIHIVYVYLCICKYVHVCIYVITCDRVVFAVCGH